MKVPLERKNKIGLALIGLLPLVLLARGLHTLFTGEYHGQPRFGAAIHLTGFEAYMAGTAYVFLALMVACAMLLELGVDKKLVGVGCGFLFFGAALSFYLSF